MLDRKGTFIMKNKILLAIADGLGDRPCLSLDGKTPLQYANTPHLDRLAENGSCGIVDLYRAGVPVGTDFGHMILLGGYDLKDYPGRGPIEAFGEGVELLPGDVALRCNFASVDGDFLVKDRRAGRIREGTGDLARALNGLEIDGVQVLFKEATEHRAVLVLRGEGLSDRISDTDPKVEDYRINFARALDGSKEAAFTAEVLNQFLIRAHEILGGHALNQKRLAAGQLAANAILTRGAGKMPAIQKITEALHYTAACVAAESTVLGVARLAGFDVMTDSSFTGNLDTDVEKKAGMAVEALKDHDFVALHYKATDLMGHDNCPSGKVQAIEKYDHMLACVEQLIAAREDLGNVIIALAADHSTPCERREHSGDPVPVVISGVNIRRDAVLKYDEISCAAGALCRMKGADFQATLLDYLEVSPKQGN